MPTLKQVFTLPTKSQWVEIARRIAVTFGSAFSASLAANEAGITNLHTAQLVGVAAGAAGLNAVYRVFITPAVAEAKVEGSSAVDALAAEVRHALQGQAIDLNTVLAVLPQDALLKVLQTPERSKTTDRGAVYSDGWQAAPAVPQSTFTGAADQVVPPEH